MAIGLRKLDAGDLENIDKKVAALRYELGWSQQDLATEADCSRPTIARLESGNTILSVTLLKVMEAINRGIDKQELNRKKYGNRRAPDEGPRRARRRRRKNDSKPEAGRPEPQHQEVHETVPPTSENAEASADTQVPEVVPAVEATPSMPESAEIPKTTEAPKAAEVLETVSPTPESPETSEDTRASEDAPASETVSPTPENTEASEDAQVPQASQAAEAASPAPESAEVPKTAEVSETVPSPSENLETSEDLEADDFEDEDDDFDDFDDVEAWEPRVLSEAERRDYHSAHSGIHQGKTAEELQKYMFSAPSPPSFSGVNGY